MPRTHLEAVNVGGRRIAATACAVAAGLLPLVLSSQPVQEVGRIVQESAREPRPWRTLTPEENAVFALGHAVFNTQWSPANEPAGRRDGLGPIFNAPSCDGCHNSRRRGRGPEGDGAAPLDLVIQLGVLHADGSIQRGTEEYGFILNTAAIDAFEPEASVTIRYENRTKVLPDGTRVDLRMPHYEVTLLSDLPLPASTVLMPRMAPPVQGAGLLERIPAAEILAVNEQARRQGRGVLGVPSWIGAGDDRVLGRFGWQATEPSVATQTASAFAREMGLTTPLTPAADCGNGAHRCRSAPTGGTPEVEPSLFDAVVRFQQLHAVPAVEQPAQTAHGARLFEAIGCSDCHAPALRLGVEDGRAVIRPYTDLLLHDLGEALADRDLKGRPVRSLWRTAPLWGMQAAVLSRQPLRLLHDGRARSIEEAILWHDGEAANAREAFERLPARDRQALREWIEML